MDGLASTETIQADHCGRTGRDLRAGLSVAGERKVLRKRARGAKTSTEHDRHRAILRHGASGINAWDVTRSPER